MFTVIMFTVMSIYVTIFKKNIMLYSTQFTVLMCLIVRKMATCWKVLVYVQSGTADGTGTY